MLVKYGLSSAWQGRGYNRCAARSACFPHAATLYSWRLLSTQTCLHQPTSAPGANGACMATPARDNTRRASACCTQWTIPMPASRRQSSRGAARMLPNFDFELAAEPMRSCCGPSLGSTAIGPTRRSQTQSVLDNTHRPLGAAVRVART